jgi:hypothetical protein
MGLIVRGKWRACETEAADCQGERQGGGRDEEETQEQDGLGFETIFPALEVHYLINIAY